MDDIGDRNRPSDQPNQVDFLLAKRRIVLVDPQYNPLVIAVELDFEIGVAKTTGERLYRGNVTARKCGAHQSLQGCRGRSAARLGSNPTRFFGCAGNHTFLPSGMPSRRSTQSSLFPPRSQKRESRPAEVLAHSGLRGSPPKSRPRSSPRPASTRRLRQPRR